MLVVRVFDDLTRNPLAKQYTYSSEPQMLTSEKIAEPDKIIFCDFRTKVGDVYEEW